MSAAISRRAACASPHGVMVNYRYDLDDIETNHEAFATRNTVVALRERALRKRSCARGRKS